MRTTDWTYLAQLARALKQERVDGKIAGDFLAEIDAHLADSDADPADEFGPPADLARGLASRDGATRRWSFRSPYWAIGVLLLVLVLLVALAESVQGGWPEEVAIPASPLAYGALVGGLGMAVGITATRRLDGRSWRAMTGWKFWLAIIVVAVLATTISTALDDVTLVTVPRGAVIGLVVVGLPLLVGLVIVAHNPFRFPDHAQHLKPLRYGIWADKWGGQPRARPSERVEHS